MKRLNIRFFLVASLLATATLAQAQVMRVHSGGSVVYAINASQVDSITFQDGTLPESLINTKWKLTGIVDAKTGVVTELEPKECKDCYTLSFGTDYTAIAHSIEFPTPLDLMNLGNSELPDQWSYYREYYQYERYEEGAEFRKAILTIEYCTAMENELRLHYSDKKSYLRFAPVAKSADDELNDLITSNLSKQGIADPERLIGKWDFITYAYSEDGITISDIPTEFKKGYLQVKNNSMASSGGWWDFNYVNTMTYGPSLSGNLIKLGFRATTLIYTSPEDTEQEVNIANALRGAYSFVIKGDELIIYYTGASDKNLLILKKVID